MYHGDVDMHVTVRPVWIPVPGEIAQMVKHLTKDSDIGAWTQLNPGLVCHYFSHPIAFGACKGKNLGVPRGQRSIKGEECDGQNGQFHYTAAR